MNKCNLLSHIENGLVADILVKQTLGIGPDIDPNCRQQQRWGIARIYSHDISKDGPQ